MKKSTSKKIILALTTVLAATVMFSQEIIFGKKYVYPSEWGTLELYPDKMIMDNVTTKSHLEKDKFFQYLVTEKEKYIVLTCEVDKIDFITLVSSPEYITEKDKIYRAFNNWEIYYTDPDRNQSYETLSYLAPFKVKSASSFLRETLKDKRQVYYLPEFLSITYNPWAVNSKVEKKEIFLSYRDNFKVAYSNAIVIANGFICNEKPYLYELNSRAKTIRISDGTNSMEYVLKDTPNFQVIPIDFLTGDKDISVEILDWYQGSKYDDIVISGIYYMS